MKNLNKIIKEELTLITETKLSRLWSHIQNRTPFGMVSLSRSDMSNKEKDRAFIRLKEEVRKKGYGYIELKGGYIEHDDEGSPTKEVVNELSLMVPNITKEHLIELGTINLGYGPQDTVLYCDGENFLGYIITNPVLGEVGSPETTFEYGKDKDALPMGKEAVSKYFSMLKKGSHSSKKFGFKVEQMDNFRLYEMGQIRTPKNPNGDWWDNFGRRII
jgi:hypothetical protein